MEGLILERSTSVRSFCCFILFLTSGKELRKKHLRTCSKLCLYMYVIGLLGTRPLSGHVDQLPCMHLSYPRWLNPQAKPWLSHHTWKRRTMTLSMQCLRDLPAVSVLKPYVSLTSPSAAVSTSARHASRPGSKPIATRRALTAEPESLFTYWTNRSNET